jgi:TolB protein
MRTTGTPGRRGARLLLTIGMAAVLAALPRTPPPASSAPQGAANATPATAPAPPLASQAHAGRIAFDNHQDVWTINADGTDLTRITDSPGPDFDPSWSPDGTRIAYRHERNDEPEIWLMNADGSGQHRLARGIAPAWSPDGLMIAYASPGTGDGTTSSAIAIMNADGSGQRRLPHTDGGEYPSWSPDGKRIAFNSNLSGDHVMYIVDVDGSRVVDLSKVGEGWQVDWSPDGRSVLFTSHRDYTDNYTDVYVMRPDGSDVRRLTHNRAYTPAWSPDGKHIVFSAPGLFVMNVDGTGITALATPGTGETSLPDWTR